MKIAIGENNGVIEENNHAAWRRTGDRSSHRKYVNEETMRKAKMAIGSRSVAIARKERKTWRKRRRIERSWREAEMKSENLAEIGDSSCRKLAVGSNNRRSGGGENVGESYRNVASSPMAAKRRERRDRRGVTRYLHTPPSFLLTLKAMGIEAEDDSKAGETAKSW
jgi:hypothetical protein